LLVLPELTDDVFVPDDGIADAVLLAQAQRQTAAGTAVAYRVKVAPAFNDGGDKPSLATVAQDISGFVPGYLASVVRHRFKENVPTRPQQNFGIQRVIAVVEYPAAVAGSDRDTFGDLHKFVGLGRGQKISLVQIFPVGICQPPGQAAEQGYPGTFSPENIEPEDTGTMTAVKP